MPWREQKTEGPFSVEIRVDEQTGQIFIAKCIQNPDANAIASAIVEAMFTEATEQFIKAMCNQGRQILLPVDLLSP